MQIRSHSRASGNLQIPGGIIPGDILFKDEDMDPLTPCVYILTNRPRGVLYIGVTTNLPQRVWQHRNKLVDGFSSRYNTDRLVWHQTHVDMYSALTRERQLKKWHRSWKIELIESSNPGWEGLYAEIAG
jgi:putative endonuclease